MFVSKCLNFILGSFLECVILQQLKKRQKNINILLLQLGFTEEQMLASYSYLCIKQDQHCV